MTDINVNAISEALNNKADLDFNNCEYKPITEDTFETADAENVKLNNNQTINGVKSFTSTSSTPTIKIQNSTYSWENPPSWVNIGALSFKDKDNNSVSSVQSYLTDTYNSIFLETANCSTGTARYSTVVLQHDNENDTAYLKYGTTPSISSNDDSDKIPTTKWVNNTINSKITNCLLENPQLVDLELKDGTLTLKAGSTVIVPYGTSAPALAIGDSLNDGTITDISWDGSKLFYYVKYNSRSATESSSTASEQLMLYISNTGGFNRTPISFFHSGNTAPTHRVHIYWYDTVNNLVKWTADSGVTWETTYWSLPYAIVTRESGAFVSIDQVFQSIGYIGNTIWSGKGIKALAPNGRTANGTLKNNIIAPNYVLTATRNLTSSNQNPNVLVLAQTYLSNHAYCRYDSNLNNNFASNGTKIVVSMIGDWESDSTGKITKCIPKNTFQALDANDTDFIAHQAMPSNKYIDLTLGVSGTQYTAPADGYYAILGLGPDWVDILNISTLHPVGLTFSARPDKYTRAFIPVKKGDNITIYYTTAFTRIDYFSFIYAEGAL